MKPLSTEQRNKVYKKSLQLYNKHESLYLCHCIGEAVRRLYPNRWGSFIINTATEFMSLKPNGKFVWWPTKDRQSRIDCLNKCIELTNPKTTAK